MGAFYESIPQSLIPWIRAQKIIWVASAPLSPSGHVNVSPKGGCYFGVISPTQFWYMDLTGSGIETISHLQEPGNGRLTILLNAFEGPPRIIRLWGHGTVMEYGTEEYEVFVKRHDVKTIPGSRAIVLLDIHQVGTSCGFSVPTYEFRAFRETLNDFFVKKVRNEVEGRKKDGIEHYWAWKSAESMDGLPGLRRAVETAKREQIEPIKKMVGPYAPSPNKKRWNKSPMALLVLIAIASFVCGVLMTLVALRFMRRGLATSSIWL